MNQATTAGRAASEFFSVDPNVGTIYVIKALTSAPTSVYQVCLICAHYMYNNFFSITRYVEHFFFTQGVSLQKNQVNYFISKISSLFVINLMLPSILAISNKIIMINLLS